VINVKILVIFNILIKFALMEKNSLIKDYSKLTVKNVKFCSKI